MMIDGDDIVVMMMAARNLSWMLLALLTGQGWGFVSTQGSHKRLSE